MRCLGFHFGTVRLYKRSQYLKTADTDDRETYVV